MTAKKPVAFSIPATTMDYVRERAKEMGVSNTMYLASLIVRDIIDPICLAEVNLYGSVGKTQQVGMTLQETVKNAFPRAFQATEAEVKPSPFVDPPFLSSIIKKQEEEAKKEAAPKDEPKPVPKDEPKPAPKDEPKPATEEPQELAEPLPMPADAPFSESRIEEALESFKEGDKPNIKWNGQI